MISGGYGRLFYHIGVKGHSRQGRTLGGGRGGPAPPTIGQNRDLAPHQIGVEGAKNFAGAEGAFFISKMMFI